MLFHKSDLIQTLSYSPEFSQKHSDQNGWPKHDAPRFKNTKNREESEEKQSMYKVKKKAVKSNSIL